MRANPNLLTGLNKYWIRFFCLAVYSTMYVRDHSRPQLYKAMQISPTDYDKKVLHITNEITKQVFPITLNLDDPRFYECMNQMLALFQKMDVYKAKGGLVAKMMVPIMGIRVGLVFARAFFLPVRNHELPRNVRLAPSW
jgi:magnesium-protoporphyrin IX monomethyl ester (oxidative) cyclase